MKTEQTSENIFTFIRLSLIFFREECFLEHDFLNLAEVVVKLPWKHLFMEFFLVCTITKKKVRTGIFLIIWQSPSKLSFFVFFSEVKTNKTISMPPENIKRLVL